MRRRTTIGAMLTAGVVAVTAGVMVPGAAPAGAAVGGSGSSARTPPRSRTNCSPPTCRPARVNATSKLSSPGSDPGRAEAAHRGPARKRHVLCTSAPDTHRAHQPGPRTWVVSGSRTVPSAPTGVSAGTGVPCWSTRVERGSPGVKAWRSPH